LTKEHKLENEVLRNLSGYKRDEVSMQLKYNITRNIVVYTDHMALL